MSIRGIVVWLIISGALPRSALAQAPTWPSWMAKPAPSAALPYDPDPGGYRLQMLVADLASLGAVASFPATGAAGPTLGFCGYLFAGPVIHSVHGHQGRAVASLGLRLVTPIVLALVVAAADRPGSGSDGLGRDGGGDGLRVIGDLLIGYGIGIPIAMLIDDLVLAGGSDPAPASPTPRPAAAPHPGLAFVPRAWVSHEQAGLGLSVRF